MMMTVCGAIPLELLWLIVLNLYRLCTHSFANKFIKSILKSSVTVGLGDTQ